MRCTPLAVSAALLLPAVLAAQTSQPSDRRALVVLSRDARRTVQLAQVGGREFVSLSDLASVLPLNVKEDPAAGGLTVTVGSRSVVLSLTRGLASIEGRLISLPAAPLRAESTWLVPLDFIPRVLTELSPEPLDLHRESRMLVVGSLRVPRVSGRVETTPAGASVTIGITPRTPHTIAQERGRLVVRFEADALDPDLVSPPPTELLAGIRTVEDAPGVAIDLGARFAAFKATDTPVGEAGTRLVIELTSNAEPTAQPTAPAPPAPAPPPPTPPPAAPGAPPIDTTPGLRTVVIDPGHGGDELGAAGPGGLLEKDVTMAVARRLKALLETRLGLRVLLTREGDTTVSLDDRAALANNNKADLFISLHANASVRASTSGAEVFYLSLGDYGQDAATAATVERESLPVVSGGNRDIELILWQMAQARHVNESAVLAQLVEEELRTRVQMSSRAIQQAPFRVLVGANMPAVLVEMGFITNPDEERRLKSSAFQDQVVQALYQSVVRFRGVRADTVGVPQPPPPPAQRPPVERYE